MCILGREAGAVPMMRLGLETYIVRELNDVMYDPARPPYLESHEAGRLMHLSYLEKRGWPLSTQAWYSMHRPPLTPSYLDHKGRTPSPTREAKGTPPTPYWNGVPSISMHDLLSAGTR